MPTVAWTGWRGPNRDGHTPWLPKQLLQQPRILWRAPLTSKALAGIAATEKVVLVADREFDDTLDLLRCLDTATGRELWALRYPTIGQLDYGNSSRATPLIDGDRVFFAGALGQLTCVSLATGALVWQKDLRAEFGVTEILKWGHCGSPLLADGKLIVNPGGPLASVVALRPKDGKVLWQSPGNPPGYGSLNVAKLGGRTQIVGHDATTLGGWDIATGQRLWTVTPDNPGDFNVPTPLIHDGRLIVMTENNATRLFGFRDNGVIDDKPRGINRDLRHDTHTPVIVGSRLFGVAQELLCLDLKDNLRVLWHRRDNAFLTHTSLIASDDRLLVATDDGELLLIDALADEFRLLGRQKVFADESGLLSHPALVGTKLFVRGSNEIVCVDLGESAE